MFTRSANRTNALEDEARTTPLHTEISPQAKPTTNPFEQRSSQHWKVRSRLVSQGSITGAGATHQVMSSKDHK